MKVPVFLNAIYSLLFSRERKIISTDFYRYYLGPKVINNKTINPWSDKTYTEEERAVALEKASQWQSFSINTNKNNGFSYHIIKKWGASAELNNSIIHALKDFNPTNMDSTKKLHEFIENNQIKNGWFKKFETVHDLDKIAYTVYMLLENGNVANDEVLLKAAIKTADRLFDVFNKKKYLKGKYNANWQGSGNINLPGYALMALVWLKLYKCTKNIQYLNVALKINDILIFFQDRSVPEFENTYGAIPASFPIWKGEEPFCFSFWATKFFVDSLTLEKECLQDIRAAYNHEK
jgi:hypothetical protein